MRRVDLLKVCEELNGGTGFQPVYSEDDGLRARPTGNPRALGELLHSARNDRSRASFSLVRNSERYKSI